MRALAWLLLVPACATLSPPVAGMGCETTEVDCEPLRFERDNPIRRPDASGHYRHMGTGREWGDGQPAVSADGRFVAFWSMRGYEVASPEDNCEAFASRDGSPGNGAPRVRACELDEMFRCKETLQLPPPEDAWVGQGQAYFHRDTTPADLLILTTEPSVSVLDDVSFSQYGPLPVNRTMASAGRQVRPSGGSGSLYAG